MLLSVSVTVVAVFVVPARATVLPLMVVLLEPLPTVTVPPAAVPRLVPAAAEAAVK